MIQFRMLSMMDLVTKRRTRMNTVLLRAIVRRFGDLIGRHRLSCGRIGRAGNTSCECRRAQHGGREQNGRDFPVHSHSSFGALVN